MKRSRLIGPVAAAVLGFGHVSHAAYLQYLDGGLFSQSDAGASGAGQSSTPGPVSQWGADTAMSAQTAFVGLESSPDVTADTDAHGFAMAFEANTMLDMSAWVGGTSRLEDGHAWGYSGVNTTRPAVTTGLLLQILPGEGEATGMPVIVHWNWSANGYTDSSATAYLNGGYGFGYETPFGITLNGGDPAADPPVGWVWRHDAIALADGNGFDNTSSGGVGGTFAASIGDIVGVHMGVNAFLDLSGDLGDNEAAAGFFSALDLSVTPVPLPATVWLFGAALLGMGLLQRRTRDG